MDHLIVVTYPEPLRIRAHPIDGDAVDEGNVGLVYYYDEHVIARGVVDSDAVASINNLLRRPVLVALAATEDETGNIDGRVCLVLPVEGEALKTEGDEDRDEPWKSSLPDPPDLGDGFDPAAAGDEDKPKMALLPIGNVVRGVRDRNHLDDVAADASEMLRNLLSGQARDAVRKAIDDLLDSI
ncbi:MAG: hypothetical protein ACRELV_09610 [Longimicrobiales bacterium]